MTTYGWDGTPETFSDWNMPARWAAGVVPDTPIADVVFPVIMSASPGCAGRALWRSPPH